MPKNGKVLLINTNVEINPNPVLPIGMAYVAASLSNNGFTVTCADLCFKRDWRKYLLHEINNFSPDFIGISIRNIDNHDQSAPKFYLEFAKEVFRLCKESCRANIFCGGAALAVMPKQILGYLGIKAGVFGDGEESTVLLLKNWKNLVAYEKIAGLVYKKGDEIIVNPARGIKDLNSVAFHDLHKWVDVKPYFSQETSYPIQAKRGCPFDCIYCTYAKGEGKCYRLREAKNVVDEIEYVYNNYYPKTIEFVDSIFNHPQGFAENICRELINRKNRANLHTIELNPGFLSEELIALMEKAGFSSCGLTCESASEKVLKNLNKSYGPKEVAAAARRLKSSKMKRLWVFLMGGPGENEETIDETLGFVQRELGRNDIVFFNIGIRIYPGTKIETIAKKEGIIGANTDLLFPAFYLSPEITRERIEEKIREIKISNIVTIRDIRLPYLSHLLKIASFFRLKGPYWSYAPILNKIRRSLWQK